MAEPEWTDDFNRETVGLAYQEAAGLQQLYAQWADAVDGKVVAVFTVASAILGLAPAFKKLENAGPPLVCWVAAAACWVIAVIFCYSVTAPASSG
jgi:hypothetical protein